MKGISVRSEVAPLKKVLLHRPGRELLNLTPASMERLLFDDIPFLKVAQEEHDAFAQLLRDNGVEVVYLEDLMTDVLRLHPELKEQFLMQWLEEGGIHTEKWQQKLLSYLTENFEGKDNTILYSSGSRKISSRTCSVSGISSFTYGYNNSTHSE